MLNIFHHIVIIHPIFSLLSSNFIVYLFLVIISIKKDCYKYFEIFKNEVSIKNDDFDNNLNYYGPKKFLAEDYKNVNIEMFNHEWFRNNTLMIKNVHLNLNL